MPNRRFLILGQPRSGSTYLMTLLDSHRAIACSGEQFNPYAIVGTTGRSSRPADLLERDRDPVGFLRRFFDEAEAAEVDRVGFKFMIGHDARVLAALPEMTDLTLIHVWRENRLAQVSSFLKAVETRRWTQNREDGDLARKVAVGPRRVYHQWHEFETRELLFRSWFDALPHRRISLEYRELFAPDFPARICDFLQVAPDPAMRSPLVKQGANRILDRFEEPGPVVDYMRALGFERWLGPEL
ncbi:Stf0 family sulfotransferase [Citreimonas salinaria]|uniref:LPS sulfotransferase NodH n=1 Tax=Citreimonas salinaria TaxID=321339 RepID=A0A1H3N3S4_9RHOB|nr:Stf0 family sulfotransferase [Citreimonas salinaria]SDY83587.1 LPS sulfotransferase NodH [Citreimonas salinaria]